MAGKFHPLLERLLRRVGATPDVAPSLEAWQALLDVVSRTYRDSDQDRYTIERAMDVSGREMQGLYQEVERQLAIVRLSEQRHRLLFQGSPLPIWLLDVETLTFVDVNDAMTRTYGYSRDELIGMPANVLKPAEDHQQLAIATTMTVEQVTHLGLRRHLRKDGTVLEMDITAHGLVIDGRRCVLGIARDMTQARRIEEELRQAQKMEAIGRLAGGVAHDFNNILAVILANAEFAQMTLGDDHPARPEVDEIKSGAERAAALTRQLLTFSRKQKRQPKILALNSIVTEIESMLARIVGEDVAISAKIEPALGAIEADPGEVEQVLLNLVVNARDAMPSGGRLVVETSNSFVDDVHAQQIGVAPGHYVVLAISDTGCGMTDAVRARIFEPFFTTKDVGKGTGLGLATVFGIVQQCGGGIAVYSELGRGTTFRIYWPRRDAAPDARRREGFVAVQSSGTVLVVEDDNQVRKVLRRYLTSWGYTLLEAPSAAAALDLIAGHRGAIDVLLTDLVMPGLDGRALSRRVLSEKPATKVVFMSGYTEHAALNNAALGPEDYFVQKPFSARVLSDTLRRAMGHAVTMR